MDWIAGATVGIFVLFFRHWLTDLYSLPGELVLVMGLANLAYASVSFTLAMLTKGDRVPFFRVVAAANVVWGIGCVVLAGLWFSQASVLGLAQLVGEAFFVGGLGVLEWRVVGRYKTQPR